MNKKYFLPLLVSFLLIIGIMGFHLSLDEQLFAPDAKNHYEFAGYKSCDSGYANGVCLMTGWLGLNEFDFWLVFFGLSMLIPIAIVVYTKNLWLFPMFFVFTGFFWQSMAMQVFAQIIVSLIFVFFVFEKNVKLRWGLLLILFGLVFFGINIHRMLFFFLIAVLIYELLALFDNVLNDLYCVGKKHGWLGCGVFSVESATNVGDLASSFREPLNNNVGNWFQSLVYYSYSFLFENMFFGFVIPGLYQIFVDVDFRKIYYFCFVIVGALWSWWYLDWQIWYVTRILLWLPLVLFVPFMDWLNNQTKNTKLLFYLMGLAYFGFNVWYFMNRVQGMGCNV